MKTILITAYAVNPYKGSEDGTGWNIARNVAKEHRVILITRKNNLPHLQKYAANHADPVLENMEFHGFDLPGWAMALKKKLGERGYVLYFYFWQFFVMRFIKKSKFNFDLAHSLNFHSDSVPHFLWKLGKPSFWGPIGHHPKVPKAYLLPVYGRKNYVRDRAYWLVKWALRNLDPWYHLAVRKSTRIFGINSTIAATVGAKPGQLTVLPAVASPVPAIKSVTRNKFQVLSVGRFHFMKGFDVTLRAFTAFLQHLTYEQREEVELVLVGKGPEATTLQELAKTLGVERYIKWVSWVEKSEMEAIYRSASVFLFPSHEGAGMVVPEAMSYGLPVLCFENAGPGELAGEGALQIPYTDYQESAARFGQQLKHLFDHPAIREQLGEQARLRHQRQFTWEHVGQVITQAYEEALAPEAQVNDATNTIAVFHPSSELYGADRILVNALLALPTPCKKRVYLLSEGPLVAFIKEQVPNVSVIIAPRMPIIYRKMFTPWGLAKLMISGLRFAAFLRRENRQYNFKSAYVNTLSASLVLPILSRLKVPNYMHVHEIIESPKLVGYFTALCCKWWSQKVVCVSQAVSDNLLGYNSKLAVKTRVLHNGIAPVKTTMPMKTDDKIHFYLFGRIMPQKGQWFLIEALSLLPKTSLQRCKFVLMGGAKPGHEHMLVDLQARIDAAGLKQVVEVKDFAPNIGAAMTEADVCLVPSQMKDPFPTTVLEAMSAGKPVIATNHGGAKEAIIEGETGLLVAPDQPGVFAEKMLSLIRNEHRVQRLGEAAQNTFQSAFTLQRFKLDWLAFNQTNGFV